LCVTEPAWERRPRDREIAARNRQLDHLLDQSQTKPQQASRPSAPTKGEAMKLHRRHILTAIVAVGALVGAALIVVPALATTPTGVTTTPIATGRFYAIDTKIKTGAWKAKLQTKGASDLHVLQNTIAPGGTFGWHSHPGPSLVIVKSGTATFYLADDPACTPHVVPAGSGFVDSGGDVHVVRNEGSVDLVTVVASLVPADAARRIDAPSPRNCLPNG
jgi:quercetin dioxygenase-like cupin family protein